VRSLLLKISCFLGEMPLARKVIRAHFDGLISKTISVNVRLKPSESSAHLRATNYTNVSVAQGTEVLARLH
jgi:hypothetical protein